MLSIDLNCDLGESFGRYTLGMDKEILQYISSANIACGWHAGDPLAMDQTIKRAKKNNVNIGAHPGFLDKLGFGRRAIDISPIELKAYVKYQLGALLAFAKAHQTTIQHLKPHGAMYNMAAKDLTLATAIAEAIKEVDEKIILLGRSNSMLTLAGEKANLNVAHEVFADRAYEKDGSLVSRTKKGALIHDPKHVIQRVLTMVTHHKVKSVTGEWIDITADSICVHGDTKEALQFVQEIRKHLLRENIAIIPLSQKI